jgi:hypothetical protein
MTGINRKCLAAGALAVALAIVIVALFVDALLADRPDANIGGGFLALVLMCAAGYYGIMGRREALERHERGDRIAVASLVFLAIWVAVLVAGAFFS